jgi:hypothetical protein
MSDTLTLFQSTAVQSGKKNFRAMVDKLIAAMPAPEAVKPSKVSIVGIWDVNSLIGDMAVLTAALNASQSRFRFFEVSGAVPCGLISDKERIVAWLREREMELRPEQLDQIAENTIAGDFFPYASNLRGQMGLHYLVGLTYSKVAFDNGEGEIGWNYFAIADAKQGREMIVSTNGLRQYAERADRPIEVAIGGLIVSMLLATISPRVEYHDDTGCIFDFNQSRESIVETIRACKIDPECVELIRADARPAAEAMVGALRNLRMPKAKKTQKK